MRFFSVHPTDVPDDHAEALFLVLADRWTTVPGIDLARAFVTCSLYMERLPASFRSNLEASSRYGLLLTGLEGGDRSLTAFETNLHADRGYAFSVAAATTQDELVRAWQDVHHFGRPRVVHLETAALAYRGRAGESHQETLARARKISAEQG